MSITVKSYLDPMGEKYCCAASFDSIISSQLPEIIFAEVVRLIAQKYVEDHYEEIAAKLDQNAVASLAIAEAGKKIAEEIRSKPTVIHEKGDTHIYQRGILGGFSRIK